MASVLELILRSRKEGDAAKKTADELKQVDKASEGAAKASKKLSIGMLAVGAAMVAGTLAIGKQVVALAEQGVEIQRAETALIAYAGSSEEAARTIDLMKDAAGEAMTKFDAARNATRLFSMGLASSADEAARLTEVAVTLGSTIGKGPQAAIEDFSLMLANQATLRLDSFGIAGEKVRGIMKRLSDEGIAPTDKQTRFLMATMEVADEKMALLGEEGYKATSSIDRVKVAFEDAKASLAVMIADGLVPAIDKFYELEEAMRTTEEEAILAAGSFDVYLAQKLADVGGAAMISAGYVDKLRARFDSLRVSAEGTAPAIEAVASANAALALSLGDVTQAVLAKEAMEGLNQAYQEGSIDSETYQRMYKDVAENIAGMPQSAIDAQLKLADLNKTFAETGDLDSYLNSMRLLGIYIGALPDKKKIHIEMLTTYGEMYKRKGAEGQHGLDMTVPPGFPRDSFPIWTSSGEHVKVTPAPTYHQEDQRSIFQGANVNINDPLARETIFSYIDQYLTGG